MRKDERALRNNPTKLMEKAPPDLEQTSDEILAKHGLTRKTDYSKARGETNKYRTTIVAPEDKGRKQAAEEFVNNESDIVIDADIPAGNTRPVVIVGFQDYQVELNFKEASGVSKKLDAKQTADMEMLSARFMYDKNIGNEYLSYNEAAEYFSLIDEHWYEGFKALAETVDDLLLGSKYVFSREKETLPPKPESIHALINATFTLRKDVFQIIGNKKDAWNPSDVYACKESAYNDVIKDWQTLSNSSQSTLEDFNSYLREMLEQKILVGISLKKITDVGNPAVTSYNMDAVTSVPTKDYKLTKLVIGEQLPSEGKTRKGLAMGIEGNGEDIVGAYRFFGSSDFNSSFGGTMQIELTSKGAKAQLGKVPTGIIKAWATKLNQPLLNKVQRRNLIWNPDVLFDMAEIIQTSFKNTTNISKELVQRLFSSVPRNEKEGMTLDNKDLLFLGYIPSAIFLAYMLASAKDSNQLEEFLNDLVNGSKKLGSNNAPFLKIS